MAGLMEPRIQYAKTKDGVSIALYATGECGNGQRPGEPAAKPLPAG